MNQLLKQLHQIALTAKDKNFTERLRVFANSFAGSVYGRWHDGSSLDSMDDFNYDLHQLDCVTFVEVVLALAKTKPVVNLEIFCMDFEVALRKIHYANGKPTFLARNHFACVDWIENNKYLVEDITHTISDNVLFAAAVIDKKNWLTRHNIIKSLGAESVAATIENLPRQISEVQFVETSEFINDYENLRQRFPTCSIVHIVRPNWDLTQEIGTCLNISHLGFAFNNLINNTLQFCHASSTAQGVASEPLLSYMTRFQDSPTIRGFNVLTITPGF